MIDSKFVGILLTVTLILLAVLYAPVVPSMVGDWYNDPNYSHGFLVPLISAYFMWERREKLRAAVIVPSNFGLVVIIGSLSLLIFGFAGTEYFTMRSSLVFLLAGIVLYCFGWSVLRVLALPIGFLIFMVPLPYIVYDALAFPLKLMVTKFSVISLQSMGVIVWQEGNIIQFPETALEVADACSGMRSMMSLLALSVAYAFFLDMNAIKRFILVLLAIPIAILTNMLRVIATGFLVQYYGTAVAEGFLHEFAGLVVFGLAMVFLVLAGTILGKVGR